MKIKSSIYTVLLFGILLPVLFCCKKDSIKTIPVITISEVTNITSNTVSAGGEVTADGGTTVTAKGICWSVNQNPIISDSKISNGTGVGSFSGLITGLNPGTTYYLKAYATNAVGTAYSNQSTFTTDALLPILTTIDLTAITANSAIGGGNITNDGGSPLTARGVCWSTSQNPTIADSKSTDGTGTGSFTSTITGLTPGTTYYLRAYATNSIGTAYGNQITLATTALLPTITTTSASDITSTTATSGGNITNDGGSVVTVRGVCWSTSQNPTTDNSKSTDGTGTGNFTGSITGLTAGSNYYIRAYATNIAGTVYGMQVNFTSANGGTGNTVTDIDGNVYHTVTIGTQVWMVENLKTTRYRDGTDIPLVMDGIGITTIGWTNLQTPGYCYYLNLDYTYKNIYGAIYNWHAVNTGKLAPTGWHVPTDSEWTTLKNYLGGFSVAGGKLKESGTSHWFEPNGGATNETGFTGLPGGARDYGGGNFNSVGSMGHFWSSSESGFITAWSWALWYYNSFIARGSDGKSYGFSVRCVKD